MLATLTIVVMLIVGYVYLTEGLFTAAVMCCNVFAAGLVAFNFWEPLADWLDVQFAGGFMAGYADALCLVVLFSLTLGLLRLATNNLSPLLLEFHGAVQSIGGAVFGLITGYLLAGFLLCVLQTLPWHEHFLNFDYQPGEGSREFLPSDRAWLALMQQAGAYSFANHVDEHVVAPDSFPDTTYGQYLKEYQTFDKYGSFEIRYARYRRYGDHRAPLGYAGEFNKELQGAP